MPIGSPGLRSPSTRWSRRIWRVRFSGTVPLTYPLAARSVSGGRPRDDALLAGRLGASGARRDRDERAHRGRRDVLDRQAPGVRAASQRERLLQRGGDDAGVRGAGRALVVLLDEEAPGDAGVRRALELEVQAEHVGQPAAEAEVVVGEALAYASSSRGVPRTSRKAMTSMSPAKATCTARSGTTLTIATPATAPGMASGPSTAASRTRMLP